MNKIIIISTIMYIIVTLVVVGFLFFGPKASENIIEKTIELREFDAVEISFSAKVTIKKGNNSSIYIKSHENIVPAVEANIENEILKLELNKKVMNARILEIELTTPKLIGVGIDGADAAITADHFDADTFYVNLNDYGNISVDVNADKIISRIKGKGTASFKGQSNFHDIIVEGNIDIDAFNLNVKEYKITTYHTGFFHIAASDKLNIIMSGTGNVVYLGDPEITSEINGTGKLLKRKK